MLRRLGLLDKSGKAISPAPPFAVYSRAKKKPAAEPTTSDATSVPPRMQAKESNIKAVSKERCVTYEVKIYAPEGQTPSGNDMA
ncbi:MAG: hypothetical protein ABUL58_07330, partial [Steroidobacter sp.]